MNYKLIRSPRDLDKSVLKHELVAVEIGGSIEEVTAHSSAQFGMILRKCQNMRTVKPLRMHRSRFRSIAA